MSTLPLISIIIPHYNGIGILTECLDSLLDSNYSKIEIIVVDNNSTDGSRKFVRSKYPDVILVESLKNLGYAGGCSLGAQKANGKYLLILNNDTIQKSDWIEPLVELMESDPKISSVQPKINNYYQRDQFDYAGGAGGFMDIFVIPFARGRIFDSLEKDNGQYDDVREIFWASGTAFLTRASVFKELDGFDEDLFAHMEEIDYHWKCHLKGYRVMVEPKSVVYHKGGATLAYVSPLKTYLNHRNSLLLVLTNYKLLNSVFIFSIRLILEGISFLRELFSGKMDHAMAHVNAIYWLMRHYGIIVKRRKTIRRLRTISDQQLMVRLLKSSIIFEYFVNGKRTFKELIIK